MLGILVYSFNKIDLLKYLYVIFYRFGIIQSSVFGLKKYSL